MTDTPPGEPANDPLGVRADMGIHDYIDALEADRSTEGLAASRAAARRMAREPHQPHRPRRRAAGPWGQRL